MVFKHAIPARLLRQVESEDPTERMQALKDIIRRRVRRSDVEPILLNLIKDDDEGVREVALEALVKFLGEEAISPYLLDSLRDKSPKVRMAALSHLRNLNFRSIHDRIEPLLHDTDSRVRIEALRTIVRLRDLAALETIVDVLITTTDSSMEKEALIQLQKVISHDARYFLRFWGSNVEGMRAFLQKFGDENQIFASMAPELLEAAQSMLEDHSLVVRTIKEQLESILPNHEFTRKMSEIVDAYLQEQRRRLEEHGIKVRPSLLEGFPGSEEQIVIDCPGFLVYGVSFEPDGILAVEGELTFPVEDGVVFTCKIVEKTLHPRDQDVSLQVLVGSPRRGKFQISVKLPVKNHGLIGLDHQAQQVLSYLKDHPKPSFEDFLISLEIPSILIAPIFTYLNLSEELHLENLTSKNYKFFDEISRRLLQAKPKTSEFSLYDLLDVQEEDFKIKITEFKQALQFLRVFCDVKQREQVDILAEGSDHLVHLSQLAMRLYIALEMGKKKKRIDEMCRELNVGPWTLLRSWKYFEELRTERVSFESELHRTIDSDTLNELNELSRSFSDKSIEFFTLDQWLDHHRYLFFLSRWRLIPIDWFAAHVNQELMEEIDIITESLSDLLLNSSKNTFSGLYHQIKSQGLNVSPLSVAFFLKLVDELENWNQEFVLFVKETLASRVELDSSTFDDAVLTIAHYIESPNDIPLLTSLKRLQMSLIDIIIFRYFFEETVQIPSSQLPTPSQEVLNQVLKWISEDDQASLWRLLRNWYLLKKEGLLVPKDVVKLTLSSMHVFNEHYTIHQLDLTQLTMQERLELNQQAIKLLKLLKEHSRPLTPVELADLSGLTPSKTMKVLSYAHSTSELRPLLDRHMNYLLVSQKNLASQITKLSFKNDMKAVIQEEDAPELNKIVLKTTKIKIKPVQFSFEWLS